MSRVTVDWSHPDAWRLKQPGCDSCAEDDESNCQSSRLGCRHHCNHSWSHDACCWCGEEFGEQARLPGANDQPLQGEEGQG